ncbi:hypothetical protein HMPREF0971_01921 [Segatella oris F0302]|uniref:Uncharacterized protein n=1 Tax=Segatella oris F0302 TaxID=649760 RepID=D1QSG2_9BACT|nr:hypothetical protein HMPREF0971_01921 [Segatella oris F0302]
MALHKHGNQIFISLWILIKVLKTTKKFDIKSLSLRCSVHGSLGLKAG